MVNENNSESLKDKINQLNGLVVVGFIDSSDSFCTILRNNMLDTIKTINSKIELLEYDVKVFNSQLEELCIIEIPTYNIYYNGLLLHSFESLATKNEIKKVFKELVIN
jgi:hypothetical protein